MMRPETSAPAVRIVDALTGDIAPSPVLGILATADHISDALSDADRLRDENAELQCYIDELIDEKGELYEKLALAKGDADDAAETIGALVAERDDLASDLVDLRDAHQVTVGLLAQARREIQGLLVDRDSWKSWAVTR